MSRFEYVRYDGMAESAQGHANAACKYLEEVILGHVPAGRAQSLALTKLEEVYMWMGKGIRDEQIQRNGEYAPPKRALTARDRQ